MFTEKEYFTRLLWEDMPDGDITTELLIEKGIIARALIISGSSGVVSGIQEAFNIFLAAGLRAFPKKKDGEAIEKGEVVIEVLGEAAAVLMCERTALNFLMRMSGIATITDMYVKSARKFNENIIIAATRKTTPGFSRFEKKAVRHGGGDPHRFNLSSGIMVKDNHFVVCGGIKNAMKNLNKAGIMQKIDVEVDRLEFLEEVLLNCPDIIMLDNMSPEDVKKASHIIKQNSPHVKIEVSGGITLENVSDYAAFADIISTSEITMSPLNMHFSLDIVEIRRD